MKRDVQKFTTARKLRRAGWSYNEINNHTKIPKSTLSGWFKDITLSNKQRLVLRKKWENGLKKARKYAAVANRKKTQERFALAVKNAEKIIKALNKTFYTNNTAKLFLSALYLGEGAKNKHTVCFANANPTICKTFITLLKRVYELDNKKFRCHLHIRADQNQQKLVRFWSNLLGIPTKQFYKTQKDNRTIGKVTKKNYRGVCAIYYYDAHIQKELLSLGDVALKKLLHAGD